MPHPTRYEIVLRGRVGASLLRPLLDDFTLEYTADGVTRLLGEIIDPAHLHGILTHLTSVNVEVISVSPRPGPQIAPPEPDRPRRQP